MENSFESNYWHSICKRSKKFDQRVFELQYRYLRQNLSYIMLGSTFQQNRIHFILVLLLLHDTSYAFMKFDKFTSQNQPNELEIQDLHLQHLSHQIKLTNRELATVVVMHQRPSNIPAQEVEILKKQNKVFKRVQGKEKKL